MLDDSIFEIFREEAREHLRALEKGFLDLEAVAAPTERRSLVDNLFRHAHSLKGDAKAMGLSGIKESAQTLEDLLDELREHPEAVVAAQINRGLAHFDQLRAAFENWHQSKNDATSDLRSTLDKAVAPDDSSPAATTPRSDAVAPPAASPKPPAGESSVSRAEPEEIFTVRVSSERLDRMLNLAGEVRISQRSKDAIQRRMGDLSEHLLSTLEALPRLSTGEGRQALDFALDQLRRVEGALHNDAVREELLMQGLEADIRQARLLPLSMLADVMRRAVRDLSQSLIKDIRFDAEVGQILLDKAVIEALKDPLLHLIRNAADHGLESPEVRRAAGKDAKGTIRIEAHQVGQRVEITVSDDGGGVRFERIRARLKSTGDLVGGDLARISDEELIPFLFKPGFTTSVVGETSGRGVGLDVVWDTMRRLQGSVRLQSTSQAGTCFRLTVPITVSTIRILSVFVGGQYFGLPLSAVASTGRAKRSDLRSLGGGMVLPIDGTPVRWVHLSELLGMAHGTTDGNHDTLPFLLIVQDGRQTAVAADDLEDESEVLLKPLGFPINALPGVFGATIRPDGSVQVVLDIAEILRVGAEACVTDPTPMRDAHRRILLVDDSPTTRAILRNVFAAAGYAVTTAFDGMDALERLRSQQVDLVISDVEMPRLNGFDLTRQIKAKFGYPVILVTGREKEEHRREGLLAGADAYLVKSTFEGQGLLEIVEQLI